MSAEKPWINPCGFDIDGNSRKKKKISLEDQLPKIENLTKVIIKRLKDLKIFMTSTFKEVNEDALISQKYSFLNPPQNMKNIYIRAYYILQVNVMAIVQLLKECDEDTYLLKLQDIKNEMRGLICELQVVLISEGLKHNDVTEELMSKAFKNNKGSLKIAKHFIAIRQIYDNMNYLSEKFKNMFISSEELKNEQPSIRISNQRNGL